MRINFYIEHKSFCYRHNDTNANNDFVDKCRTFLSLTQKIYSCESEDVIHVNIKELYKTEIVGGTLFSDVLNNYERLLNLFNKNKDLIKLLYTLLDKAVKCSEDPENLFRFCLESNKEKECCALIVLKEYKYPFERNVISSIDEWFALKRKILGSFSVDVNYFLDQSKLLFERIIINESTRCHLREVLPTHRNKIIKCLSCINDSLIHEFLKSDQDLVKFLPSFARNHDIDEGSLEGKKDEKFYFKFEEGKFYCEAHLKFFSDDNNNQKQHCRVYFKKPLPGDKKVYIGYIGRHL